MDFEKMNNQCLFGGTKTKTIKKKVVKGMKKNIDYIDIKLSESNKKKLNKNGYVDIPINKKLKGGSFFGDIWDDVKIGVSDAVSGVEKGVSDVENFVQPAMKYISPVLSVASKIAPFI
jgi:hypothetical protein